MSELRPRRSVLYMPGANDKALEKAKTLPTDAVIFDTEDSVAPDMKPAAREKVASAVGSGDYGRRELTIRVNGLDTEWNHDDLVSAAQAGPSSVRYGFVGRIPSQRPSSPDPSGPYPCTTTGA